MLPNDYACPRCNCRACYALHRKGIDWLFSFAGLRPARCLTCNRRFYARYTMNEDGKSILKGQPDPVVGAAEVKSTAPGKPSVKSFDTAA